MRNIKLTIEYDGTSYSGWQTQKEEKTIQSILTSTIEKMVHEPVKLVGASRTDAGVHAYGQTANFKTKSEIETYGFLNALNSLLPRDIAIKKVEDVPSDFNSNKDAKKKHYRYLLMISNSRPAINRNRVWFVKSNKKPKNILTELNNAAKPLIGIHDFSSFCGAGDSNKTKVRKIIKIKISEIKDESSSHIICFDIVGTGFLKHMVRNIVGTLVDIVINKKRSDMQEILNSHDRNKAGVTAPACGLCLMKVYY